MIVPNAMAQLSVAARSDLLGLTALQTALPCPAMSTEVTVYCMKQSFPNRDSIYNR
ncbi:hypothetical protein RP726_19305 [Candidatus Methylospira mobilis]|uniref:hypothetical protein n=1 Tax=Candidatus Methylospira mobilis TaxID=1808979 RepID=UPI001292D6F9|nr:hypothetical protein [Candidatus Methylospira mobilis]WNV04517.1 hypothetical protein RP726_19305 [Candidatus Methylospira mobilis]